MKKKTLKGDQKKLEEAERRLKIVASFFEDRKKAYKMLLAKLSHTSHGYTLFAGGNPYVKVDDAWVDQHRESYERRLEHNTPHHLYILEVYLDSSGGGGYDGRVRPRGRGPDSYENHLTSGVTNFMPNVRPLTYKDVPPQEYEIPGDVREYEFRKLFWRSEKD
jgi:hypothetical protein